MAEKFKKIDKEYTLSDSTVNCYGFRLLTAGYQASEYQRNPIGYYMHGRDAGVLLKWDDLRIDGDLIKAKPVINLSHPRGQQTVDEIETGFLNAASMGHFVVLEMSSDTKDMLEGQTGPTVTKWYNRECSLVDIPGNYNALKLFDKEDNEINLADFTKNSISMKQIFFTPAQLTAMNLKADADNAAVELAFNNLVAQAQEANLLTQQLSAEKTAHKLVKDELAALKETTTANEVASILDKALNADKKITKQVHDTLKADYATNPTGLKALIDAMPVYTSVTERIATSNAAVNSLAAKSWSELDKAGKLEDLKAADLELFKAKYKEQFNKDYKG